MNDPQPEVVAVLQALAGTRHHDEDLNDAVVTKFAAVVEWMDPAGKRWLSLVNADAGGERLYRWDVQGMLFNLMHDRMWDSDEGDDEDDE